MRWKKGQMEHEKRKMEDGRRIGATMARFEVVKVREEKRSEEARDRDDAPRRSSLDNDLTTRPHMTHMTSSDLSHDGTG